MITKKDIERFDIPASEIEFCKLHPVQGCKMNITGQLKAIGDSVVRRVVGFDQDAFKLQAESAREMGVVCVCEDEKRKSVGISTTVSLIKDHDVLDKQLVVPAGQIRRHPYLDHHNTVAVYVVGSKDGEGNLANVQGIYAAGWLPVFKLRRFVQKGGSGAFQVRNMALAVAPITILNPLRTLQDMVRWHHICV